MNKIRYMMDELLLFGIVIALFFLIYGGCLFIITDGSTQLINYRNFYGEPKNLTSLPAIIKHAKNYQAKSLIQVGLYTLFLMQVLRIILASWFFLKAKDTTYIVMSIFILCVMLASLWISF